MMVVMADPDVDARGELVALLQRRGIAVAPFADPHVAFLFLLGKLGEVDGVLVNDDAEWSSWLRSRLEILPVALTVVTYSGRGSDREARVTGGLAPIESHAA